MSTQSFTRLKTNVIKIFLLPCLAVITQALVYKFGTLRHYMPLVEEAERARLVTVKELEAGAGPKLSKAVDHETAQSNISSQQAQLAENAVNPGGVPSHGVLSTRAGLGPQGAAVGGTLASSTAVSGRPLTAPEAMDVDVEGTGAGEEQVDVGDDVEIEVGAEGAGSGAAAIAVDAPSVTGGTAGEDDTSGMTSAAPGAVAGARTRGGFVARNVSGGGRGGVMGVSGASTTVAVTAGVSPTSVPISAVAPSPAASTTTASTATRGAGSPGRAGGVLFRGTLSSGSEVANSAASTLKIAREPQAPREDGAPRKFALGGPPEVGDSVQEVKVRG